MALGFLGARRARGTSGAEAGIRRAGWPPIRSGAMLVLGIETSCDETAAAVVRRADRPRSCANLVLSQLAEHAPYGGVVPEIAARAHLEHLDRLIARALAEAGVGSAELDGDRRRPAGPGLIGGVMVGVTTAKAMALAARQAASSRSIISKAMR